MTTLRRLASLLHAPVLVLALLAGSAQFPAPREVPPAIPGVPSGASTGNQAVLRGAPVNVPRASAPPTYFPSATGAPSRRTARRVEAAVSLPDSKHLQVATKLAPRPTTRRVEAVGAIQRNRVLLSQGPAKRAVIQGGVGTSTRPQAAPHASQRPGVVPRGVDPRYGVPWLVRAGVASNMGPRFPDGYLALPHGPGWVARICGAGACVTMTSNDAGPDLAMQRQGRVADLSVATFERVCGVSWRMGLCNVSVTIVGRAR